ncbi:uncharacterized protein LOC109543981 isoform X2 [Dendroctonus ponderosae]|uniref:uncharacterized protein LOC109543981 isoform X2 n=1 Tax=Dendroctonus ponderosae TaxID=77166 RepID=UPI002035F42A|nr:uncharacterized protein LOC109543981 isoform X2 [Dendroctonus ponderosae]
MRRQPQTLAIDCGSGSDCPADVHDVKKQLETLIEHKCKQIGKTSFNGKCNAIHLEQWMKSQLDNAEPVSPVVEHIDEVWTEDKLRKRSEELQLIDSKGNVAPSRDSNQNDSMCEELILSDHDEPSPSKSTTTESQVTVRSSPVVPETVPVCRQCHKKCLSNILSSSELSHSCANQRNNNHAPAVGVAPAPANPGSENDWQSFLLLGICANPVASLVKYDPFKTPEISVAPPTPENSVISDEGEKPRLCLTNGTCDDSMENRQGSAAQTSDDDSPQTEEHPYHSLSNSVQTLRRFGTLSSLEQFGSEAPDDAFETNCSSEESLDEDDECLGLDNEAFNHTSIMSWTARAGSFVAEKMAFFEKLDYRSGGGFFDRYLKSPEELKVNGDEAQEEETSGGTSGEEVWGTPTSGDLDDPLCSPSFEGKQSPNESYSSDNMDDTELMMDELLMAPPITGAILRGLLPRRTLEPLIEEDFSDSSSSPSSDPISPQSGSSDQDIRSGSAADTCFPDVAAVAPNGWAQGADLRPPQSSSWSGSVATTTSPEENARQSATTSQSLSSEWGEAQKVCADDAGMMLRKSRRFSDSTALAEYAAIGELPQDSGGGGGCSLGGGR